MEAFPSTAARPKSSALDCTRAAQLFGGALDWRRAASDAANFPAPPAI
jgi:dTDP-4-dehydrorhamnose reductase